jgi:hypothetical protein
MVRGFLQAPDLPAWQRFEREYLALLEERFASDRRSFEVLAELAQVGHVFLGCSCPTSKNPDVWHCHTVLALQFMKRKFPDLTVVLPPGKGV